MTDDPCDNLIHTLVLDASRYPQGLKRKCTDCGQVVDVPSRTNRGTFISEGRIFHAFGKSRTAMRPRQK